MTRGRRQVSFYIGQMTIFFSFWWIDRIGDTAYSDLGTLGTVRFLLIMAWSCLQPLIGLDIEAYLSRAFGFALLAISILTMLLTGSVPLGGSSVVGDVDTTAATTDDENPRAPYAVPTLLVTTLFHSILAFYNYTWYLASGQTALGLGMVGSAVVASVGIWCLLFATSKGHISRRTGADKRTSGYPFRNVEADKKHSGKKRL